MAQALFYSSNAVAMTLASAGIGSGDVSCTLSAVTGLPASFPFKLLIGWGTGQQEVVHCTALAGSVATIVRGQDGTTAQSHSIGASVVHGVSAREFNDLEIHVAASGAVHGLTGSIVGTTDAQTLTSKTLTAPIISTISNTGTLTLPTSTDTLVGRATTDTLTNKTLTSAVLDAASTLGGVSGTSLAADRAAWTAYTPTLTNMTLGNGVVDAHYQQVGKTVSFHINFVLGSTSAITASGGGAPAKFSLPAAPASDQACSAAFLQNAGGNVFAGACKVFAGTSSVTVAYASGVITTSTPFAFTNGDSIAVSGEYEAA